MRRRLENLPPLGDLVATEVAKCGFTVETFCAVAHIGKTTYYKLLFGKTSWPAYTSDSCAVWGSITQRRSLSSSSNAISMRCFYKLRVQSEMWRVLSWLHCPFLRERCEEITLLSSFFQFRQSVVKLRYGIFQYCHALHQLLNLLFHNMLVLLYIYHILIDKPLLPLCVDDERLFLFAFGDVA